MTTDLEVIGAASVALRGSTNIVMILDRSGSMAGKESDVIGGFNSFISSCRDANLANCSVTYVRFDMEVERVFTEELADVPELTGLFYQPRGNTALLDAVGQSVSSVTSEPDNRYIVVTFTDGHENASREWTKEKVSGLLRERETLGNWTFAFFGADIDAWAEAGDMGFGAGNAASHASGATHDMMAASGRVASVLARGYLARSVHYAEAVESVAHDPGVSDEEIERTLAGEGHGGHVRDGQAGSR
jgi:hypothetical protein